MHQRLTDAAIKAVKPTPQTTYHWDGELPGFGFRVTKTGVKTFVVLLGRGNRRTLGRYPLLGLQDARGEAKRLLAERTLGKTHAPRVTHSEALRRFLADCTERLRPKTLEGYGDTLRLHFPFGTQQLDAITTHQIVRALSKLPPSAKEHAIRVGKTYFTWCMRHGLLDKSPMALMQNKLSQSRERVLNDEELKIIYQTASQGQTHFHKIVLLLILTGQRRGEIGALKWEWINEAEQTIKFPATLTKNKRTHTIPYGDLALSLFQSINRLHRVYVFPAARNRRADTPATTLNGWGKPKAAFDKDCGITDWTLHDLRRTFATGLQRLGVRIEVTENLLNHISGTRAGVAGIYSRYNWLPEAREALTKWENHLATL